MKSWIATVSVTLANLIAFAVVGTAAAVAAAATPGFPADGSVPSGVVSAASADGSTVVVGDPETGRLLVYVRPAGGWGGTPAAPAVVQATNARSGELIGVRVAITDNGDRIAATTSYYMGAAMVFERPAGGWATGSYTGWRVADIGYGDFALSGDGSTLAVGSAGRDRILVYNRDRDFNYFRSGTYIDGMPTAEVALSRNGGLLVTSHTPDDPTHSELGDSDVMMVPRPAIGWSYQSQPYRYQLMQLGDPLPGFGSDVAISGDGRTVVVGADGGVARSALAIYRFDDWTSTRPSPTAILTAGSPVERLGEQVAASPDGGTIAATGASVAGGGPVAAIFLRPDPWWMTIGEAAAVVPAADDVGDGWRIHVAGGGRDLFAGGTTALVHHRGDVLGPRTTVTTVPGAPGGRDGWHVDPVSFSVVADDGSTGAGVAEMRCALDPATAPTSFADLPAGPCPGNALATATGAHRVYAAAADSFGNVGEVEAIDFLLDAVPPRVSLPAAITVDAPTHSGTNVQYSFGSSDDYATVVPVICAPAPGAFFPVGTSTVRCNAIDQAGNVTEGTFDVTVRAGSAREDPPGEDPPRTDPPGQDPPRSVPPGDVPSRSVPPGGTSQRTAPPGDDAQRGGRPGDEDGSPSAGLLRLSALAVRNRTLTVHVSAAARLRVELARCGAARRGRVVCRTVVRASAEARRAGTVRLGLPARLAAGRYRVTVRASAKGASAKPLVKSVGVGRP
ncbi:HYR domain-containing protein [Conexibacter stalactiti]|uniref:HYR domain-containing protein n=1 Tax=Conexibacter stalactiti TaxID=1940611 RepID=A0ABU4HLD6_9ACTN|nr:HYR domain-containing protein [Conexibacter stalactiti]MDW5594118.1 HYR domain-containing protein [Conexibacter stalactiti]MEC5034760.1 HYR domain-containing protein [Conexibacter stalactiti]